MGFFSRTKKSAPASAPTYLDPTSIAVKSVKKPGPLERLSLKSHQIGFLKHAIRDRNGLPMASQMYWNSNPHTFCHELQQNSRFILDGNNLDLYDIQDLLRKDERPRYTFNVVHSSKADQNAVSIVGATPDYALVRLWLRQCHQTHQECQATEVSEKLNIIDLIDVRNGRLVRYAPGLQYVALSYVWGGAAAPERIPEQPFDLPKNISKTIQHAMVVAENLGIPFLWADAVCIDQYSREKVDQQVPLMDYIYEHAFATIVALGDHANIGLPGVQGGPERFPQLFAEFGPFTFIARYPSLHSQIKNSTWSTRGWTYQEGLFSRRCIYFSQHQVYFHCNSMFCAEDSPSLRSISQNVGSNTDAAYISRNSLLINTRSPAQAVSDIDLFASYLAEYSSRKVRKDEDAIKAFSALLSHLQRTSFPGGFINGIPSDHFRDGLLWRAYGCSYRRKKGGFPSWSWAAWVPENGGMDYRPLFYKAYKSVHGPLSIWLGNNNLYASPAMNTTFTGLGLELQHLWNTYHARDPRPFVAKSNPSLTSSDALYIDGPIASIAVTYDPTTQDIGFDVPPHLVPQVRLVYYSPPAPKQPKTRHDFLIMDTKHIEGSPRPTIQFTLLMLLWDSSSVATRAGICTLEIEDGLEVFWNDVRVRRYAFWLI